MARTSGFFHAAAVARTQGSTRTEIPNATLPPPPPVLRTGKRFIAFCSTYLLFHSVAAGLAQSVYFVRTCLGMREIHRKLQTQSTSDFWHIPTQDQGKDLAYLPPIEF